MVDDGHSASGRAAGQSAQVVIFDVDKDPGFAPHRAIARASGFRAVQSTPLVGLDGHVVAMVSTHFRVPTVLPIATCTPSAFTQTWPAPPFLT